MYERFTDRARKVMELTRQEACRFNHDYIGTEHIVLGLIRENSGVAAAMLKNFGIDTGEVRRKTEKLLQCGPDIVTMGKLPQTPRAKKVIEYSMEEARNLGHDYVGTEHILLGLLREQEGVAAQVLAALGMRMDSARTEARKILSSDSPRAVSAIDVASADLNQHQIAVRNLPATEFQGMDKYVGCKIIAAKPMDECTFLTSIKGQDTSNRETRPGYLVIYPDGYKSWSPKEAFEIAYRKVTAEEYDLFDK